MGRDLVPKALRDLRRAILGWSVGLGLTTALVASFYPSIRDNEALEGYLETLPEAARVFTGGVADITSVGGYFQAELFNLLPLVLAVLTIGKAASLTVGEERDGVLDLVLAQPVQRWRVFVDRFLGLALAVLAIQAVASAVLGVSGAILGLTTGQIAGLVAWPFLAGLLALFFGAVALAVAGFAHDKRGPVVAATTVAVGSFLFDGLAPLSATLAEYRDLGPYRWYAASNPAAGEVAVAGTVALLLVTLVLVALGAWGFEQKDLAV